MFAGFACHREPPPQKYRRPARVKSFTEATPVVRVVSAPPYAFAATATGLDQWDLRSGHRVSVASRGPIFTTRISDLAYDSERRALWIVGSDGVARYDLTEDKVTQLPLPPAGEPASALVDAVVAPSSDGGVWLGLERGLFYADPSGHWRPADLKGPVSALHLADDAVYVGTPHGLYVLHGDTPIALDSSVGCELASVRLLLRAPGGGVLAIGSAPAAALDDGERASRPEQRIALVRDDQCQTYRASPATAWLDAVSDDAGRAMVLTEDHVFELGVGGPGESIRRLSRAGMTLLPVTPESGSTERRFARGPLVLRQLDAAVPAGAQTLAISKGELLVGTRSLGTARLIIEGRAPDVAPGSRWLRRSELAQHAVALSVACREAGDCLLANGSGGVWGFDGDRFRRSGDAFAPGPALLGVIAANKKLVGLLPSLSEPVVDVIALPAKVGANGAVSPAPIEVLVRVAVPAGLELRRLRRGPGRSLLLAWGGADAVAGSPLALAQWISLTGPRQRTLGAGGVGLLDVVACDGRIYGATAGGVVNLLTGAPAGELIAATRLECDRGSLVAATEGAIVRLGDDGWATVVPLSTAVRDFAVAADGRVFLATGAGLGIWDGDRVRRYDVRRGLLDNDILEIDLDAHGRIWIRGRSGVGLFRP